MRSPRRDEPIPDALSLYTERIEDARQRFRSFTIYGIFLAASEPGDVNQRKSAIAQLLPYIDGMDISEAKREQLYTQLGERITDLEQVDGYVHFIELLYQSATGDPRPVRDCDIHDLLSSLEGAAGWETRGAFLDELSRNYGLDLAAAERVYKHLRNPESSREEAPVVEKHVHKKKHGAKLPAPEPASVQPAPRNEYAASANGETVLVGNKPARSFNLLVRLVAHTRGMPEAAPEFKRWTLDNQELRRLFVEQENASPIGERDFHYLPENHAKLTDHLHAYPDSRPLRGKVG